MKQIEIPACKEQKAFEDFVKTLLKVCSDLTEHETDELLEYAMKLAYESKH